MRKKILLLCILCSHIANAQEAIESYSTLSDDVIETVNEVKIIRQINSGTVIIPKFDNSCPEELKSPFAYACKIVEEYMPPCLPLTISVSCNVLTGSNRNSPSKVGCVLVDTIIDETEEIYLPQSSFKGIALEELVCGSYQKYVSAIPNVEFLNRQPDIFITYNSAMLEDFSFSLGLPEKEQYDFVSIAIRDILTGLGLTTSFRYNPITKGLDAPAKLTPYEKVIESKLNATNSITRLANATKGELSLLSHSPILIKLYAPATWTPGVSLRYFIPNENVDVTQILSKDFGRGTVVRSLSDNNHNCIFRDLLNWRPNVLVGFGTHSTEHLGSTSYMMPYDGNFNIRFGDSQTTSAQVPANSASNVASQRSSFYNPDVYDYLMKFHQLQPGGGENTIHVVVSILKKDGTWDVVKKLLDGPTDEWTFALSDLEFHCENDEYARTVEGYLRARISRCSFSGQYYSYRYSSRYFVIDYLPQTVKVNYQLTDNTTHNTTRALPASKKLTLYFSNLEGANKIILERLRPGARVPSKTEIPNFKKGFFETTIDRTTTFTVVAYNDNGSTRSESKTIEVNSLSSLKPEFKLLNEHIYIRCDSIESCKVDYSIYKLDNYNKVQNGNTDGSVNISNLTSGSYILTVDNPDFTQPYSYKFNKR